MAKMKDIKIPVNITVGVALDAEAVRRRILDAYMEKDFDKLTGALKMIIGLPAPEPGAVKVVARSIVFNAFPESKGFPGAVFNRHEAATRAAALLEAVCQVVKGEIDGEGR